MTLQHRTTIIINVAMNREKTFSGFTEMSFIFDEKHIFGILRAKNIRNDLACAKSFVDLTASIWTLILAVRQRKQAKSLSVQDV